VALQFASATDKTVVAALQAALKDAHPRVRVEAAGTLTRLTPTAAEPLQVLLAALKQEKPSEARRAAVRNVARLGPRAKAGVPDLICLAQEGKVQRGYGSEAWWVVIALGRIGPDAGKAVPALVAKLSQDEANPHSSQPNQANPVALALARIGAGAVPKLRETLRESKDAQQRRGAVIALGYLGPVAKDSLADLQSALARIEAKKDPDTKEGWMRTALTNALARIRDPQARPPAEGPEENVP
jgi:HEAT repeat protein